MSLPQTAVTLVPAVAFAGQVADNSDCVIDTVIAEVAIDAGEPVCKGTGDEQGKLPTSSGDVLNHFRGIAIYDAAKMPIAGAKRYAVGDAVPILVKGRIWVAPGETLTTDDVVYAGYSGGSAAKFWNDAQSTTAALVAGASVRRGGTTSALAMLELNRPAAVGPTGATGPTGPTGPTG